MSVYSAIAVLCGGLLRHCWARKAGADPVFCYIDHLHSSTHYGIDPIKNHGTEWLDAECAPSAGRDGCETAALQILELSWQLDFQAFHWFSQTGRQSVLPATARAIAARLRHGLIAAPADLRRVEAEVSFVRSARTRAPDTRTAAFLAEQERLLLEVAGRLRPFAGGSCNPADAVAGDERQELVATPGGHDRERCEEDACDACGPPLPGGAS